MILNLGHVERYFIYSYYTYINYILFNFFIETRQTRDTRSVGASNRDSYEPAVLKYRTDASRCD